MIGMRHPRASGICNKQFANSRFQLPTQSAGFAMKSASVTSLSAMRRTRRKHPQAHWAWFTLRGPLLESVDGSQVAIERDFSREVPEEHYDRR